ncbi:alanine racemase [Microcella daejeonensis]|uniref:alanine racemase C-terminal domain-containing protein n=1 Tax=Microcella daejeonensis TaxID=2994971 RepID=UPI00227072D8|nr:alanine racemase C-terminal domain-containing protein [Microcella daejeonensis]WAB83308.1 alanine racemase [Microcella daejeonensis]
MSARPVGQAPGLLAAPVLRVSPAALRANAAVLVGRDPGATADLRRDARGHGLARVGRVLAEAGLRRAVLDPRDLEAARALGLEPSEPPATLDLDLLLGLPGAGGAPVSTLVSAVATTKILRAGEGVSYGLTHRALNDTRVALVPGGYSHGIVRALGNAAEVAIGGRRHPIVGRIAMDVMVVDVGDADVEPGAPVVLLGDARREEPTVADWARITGLTAAELLTAVALRCPTEDDG